MPTRARAEQGPSLFDEPPRPAGNLGPSTRTADPETSHAAAERAAVRIKQKHLDVLSMFHMHGAMHDEALVDHYRDTERQLPGKLEQQTDSGIRSRRAELVAAKYLRATDKKARTKGGGESMIWEVVRPAVKP